jgi:hypothetical protein
MPVILDQGVGRSAIPTQESFRSHGPRYPPPDGTLKSAGMPKKVLKTEISGLRSRCHAAVSSESILMALTIRLFRVSGSFADPIQFR